MLSPFRKPTLLGSLFPIGTALLFISWETKRFDPNLFGGAIFQTSCAILGAVILSIGLFLSLRLVLDRSNPSRRIIWPFLGYLFGHCALVLYLIGSAYIFGNILNSISTRSTQKTLAPMIQKLSESTEADERQAVARIIYITHGLKVSLPSGDGTLVTFQPTAEDEEHWQEEKKTTASLQKTLDSLEFFISQMHRLIVIYLGSLAAVFAIGAIIVTLKKTPPQPAPETA